VDSARGGRPAASAGPGRVSGRFTHLFIVPADEGLRAR
jgi:hypothetical protein